MLPHHAVLDFEGRRLQGARPFAVWETHDGTWQNTFLDTTIQFPFADGNGDPLAQLQHILRHFRDFYPRGGAIGFLSYDLARQIEPRAFVAEKTNSLQIPDARFVFYQELLEVAQPKIEYSNAEKNILTNDNIDSEYETAIARILEFIAAGDIYQANYTRQFARPLPCSPAELYERLRSQNPAPFGAFLEWDDFAVVSNSPERFLKLSGRVLEAHPIKGTIRRGRDSIEDEELKNQLHLSAKDRAENVMIVDLLRNDLGRVCEYGSVHVPSLFEVKTFPTLHHLVSTVRGTLRENCDSVDAIRACFPCGSITGAPKIRAMQIIDELETSRRGVSMGAVGCFAFNGDMDWNVAIRTITCKNDTAYFHVGGGIVADSSPHDEYKEVQLKASALMNALRA